MSLTFIGRLVRASAFLALLPLAATGCRSAFIAATIQNNTPAPLQVLEVDYPSASFGADTLAAHTAFHYRFKVQGSGPVKIQFMDNTGTAHSATGPELREGQQGSLNITVASADRVIWEPKLTPQR